MPIYSVNTAPNSKTAQSTGNATKLFDSNARGRQGYSVCNPTTSILYVEEVPAGTAPAPTSAAVVASPSAIVPAGGTYQSNAGEQVDVYIAVVSGTAGVNGQELL